MYGSHVYFNVAYISHEEGYNGGHHDGARLDASRNYGNVNRALQSFDVCLSLLTNWVQIHIGVFAVTQGCCQPGLQSSTQHWAVVHAKSWCCSALVLGGCMKSRSP